MTILTRRTFTVIAGTAMLVAACLAFPAAAGKSTAGTAIGSATLTVAYTGTGVVDGNHRLWIWLFDTPDFGPGSMPIREESLATSGASVTIRGLSEERVWVAVAYDEQGGFTGSAPPPSGSPVGIYSTDGGAPSALRPAQDPAVRISFGDEQRMP